MPNVYLLDITAANRDAVYKLVAQQPGVEGKPEMMGAVSATDPSRSTASRWSARSCSGVARRYSRQVTVSPAPAEAGFHAGAGGHVVEAG